MKNLIHIILTVLLFLWQINLPAQSIIRSKYIVASSDTILIDTLPLIPSSLIITNFEGKNLDSCFKINYFEAKAIINCAKTNCDNIFGEQILFIYKVFPFKIPSNFQHKSTALINKDPIRLMDYEQKLNTKIANKENVKELNKSGHLTRGFSMGNKQDLGVKSGFQLQLSGMLTDEIEIIASVTDNNIPIQPEGTSQQIQEFDKILIQISKSNNILSAGDIEIKNQNGAFMRYQKKVQGVSFTAKQNVGSEEKKIVTTSNHVAFAKGKFVKNSFQGIEGNQGPYKIKGANNEWNITIIAGSERVYIDGNLLIRGADNDYIIDYNLAEITFTPNLLITKDKRIVVECEYTEKAYIRNLITSSSTMQLNNSILALNYYLEQDLKNKPVNRKLLPEEVEFLNNIGDSLQNALFPNIDSVEFSNDFVLYKRIDSIVNNVAYNNIYVYSNNPDSAFFRLGFMYVGQHKGNYILEKNIVNGRVFKWVAPIDSISQGDYEPVRFVNAPQRKQMLSSILETKLSKQTTFNFEFAITENNNNTFSSKDKADNVGVAFFSAIKNEKNIFTSSKNKWKWNSSIEHTFSQNTFQPIERYKPVEFQRNWAIINNKPQNEHLILIKNQLVANKNIVGAYEIAYLSRENAYNGIKHNANTLLKLNSFNVKANAAITDYKQKAIKGNYFTNNLLLTKQFKWIQLGLSQNYEQNSVLNIHDSLTVNSFKFSEYEGFISSSDTMDWNMRMAYKIRNDWNAFTGVFKPASTANESTLNFGKNLNKNNQIQSKFTYRTLSLNDSIISTNYDNNTMLGEVFYQSQWLRKTIRNTLSGKMGSGLIPKKEFTYIEVPMGQGIYIWNDYNGNNIKELDEFEVAPFVDQANYIRVYLANTEYIKSYNYQLTEIMSIQFGTLFKQKKGFKGFIGKISNDLSYSSQRKLNKNKVAEGFLPFGNNLNEQILTSNNEQIRNSLFYNKTGNIFGLEHFYNLTQNKQLLLNGFEKLKFEQTGIRLRLQILKSINLQAKFSMFNKQNKSDVFMSRDFDIIGKNIEPSINYTGSRNWRLSYTFRYTDKQNKIEAQKNNAFINAHQLEWKHSLKNKGSLQTSIATIRINYDGNTNSSLANEMLEGYMNGNNYQVRISYMVQINKTIICSFFYEGRTAVPISFTHVGNVQLRMNL